MEIEEAVRWGSYTENATAQKRRKTPMSQLSELKKGSV